MIAALREGGCVAPIGVEVYSDVLDSLDPEGGSRSLAATRRARRASCRGPQEEPMDFSEDEDHVAIAEAIRARAARRSTTTTGRRASREHRFPWEFYERMAEGGWVGIAMPEQYGGGGRGITEAAIVLREVAASGAAMNGCSALHLTIFGLQPVVKFGKRPPEGPRSCPGRAPATCTWRSASPSPTPAPTRRASPPGPSRTATAATSSRGRKIWTTKALESEVVLLLARTGPPTAGSTASRCSSPTSTATSSTSARSPRWAATPSPRARSPTTACPSRAGAWWARRAKGWRYLLHGLNPERILLSAEAIGIGEASVAQGRGVRQGARGVRPPDRREPGHQRTRWPRRTSSCRPRGSSSMHAAWRYDHGLDCGEAANSAKYLAAEAALLAADRAVQTLGGMGYATEYHVERYFREARLHAHRRR